jgi:hypothetical protein
MAHHEEATNDKGRKQIFWLGVFIGAAFTTLLGTIAWQEPFAAGLLLIAGAVSAILWSRWSRS